MTNSSLIKPQLPEVCMKKLHLQKSVLISIPQNKLHAHLLYSQKPMSIQAVIIIIKYDTEEIFQKITW